jgi:hypothetical protein
VGHQSIHSTMGVVVAVAVVLVLAVVALLVV